MIYRIKIIKEYKYGQFYYLIKHVRLSTFIDLKCFSCFNKYKIVGKVHFCFLNKYKVC